MKVAVIEDETAICEMLCDELEDLGYDVRSAPNGADGLELIKSWRPQIVVCDVNMPKMSGFQLRQ